MPKTLAMVFAFLFGAAVGSFVNVCIYRLPRRLSIVRPPSHCPHCGTFLRVADLVPLLSYLWLVGKCRYCKTPISPRYFVVELTTALLFIAAVARYDVSIYAALVASALAALLIIAAVDWEFFLVPDEAIWVLAFLGIVKSFLADTPSQMVQSSVAGAVVGASVIWLIGTLGRWMFRREAMGFGDVKIAAAVGTHLGLTWTLLPFFLLSVFIGALLGVAMGIVQRRGLTGYMPFGPALAVAAGIVLLYPREVTELALRLYGLR
ncbi:Type 4 prepilin-like proteins leader peptide-processing enzyme [bacterium HR17]|jgi:leader peptidase (prepilin peptidase)/N-methyltransferase|uniref:Type 4 prepilin-like proteins leader peptide-processing enzyme n=1 Tax=Candidatus Fervidibacter japonicus TaxID=2035412 RepID=A0A2H5XAH2_9BACT|nr:Type 4 prepilin-like proteins leader peptide-processing enzyme [bacterium HR17]